MTEINRLSAVDTVSAGDQVPIYSQSNGDARKASMTVIQEFILANSVGALDASVQPIEDTDYFAIYDSSQGKTVKILATLLLDYVLAGAATFQTQRAAPSSSGFSVQITDSSENTWLILTPTAGFAAGTLVLPAVANAIDKQEILVNCTQIVSALTINGNGATAVTGEPLVLAADGFFKLRFDLATSSWYRVG